MFLESSQNFSSLLVTIDAESTEEKKKTIQMHNSRIVTEQVSKTMQSFKEAAISSKQQAARTTRQNNEAQQSSFMHRKRATGIERKQNTRSSATRHACRAIKTAFHESIANDTHGEAFCARVHRTVARL